MRPIAALLMRNSTGGNSGGPLGPLLETGSSTTDVLGLPGYAAGDVVFIHVFHSDAGGHAFSPSPPTGWTQVSSIASFSNTITQVVYRKVMTGGEGANVTLNLGIGATQARAFTVTGVNTSGSVTEAVVTNSGTGSGTTANITSAAVTTLGNNRLLLNFFGTLRGTNATMAEGADAWTDIHMTNSTALSNHPNFAASKQTAATTGTYTAETRTEDEASTGDILYNTISFAVIML